MSASTLPALERRGMESAPHVEQTGAALGLVGYACRFDQLSEPIGSPPFREVIRPAALARLAERRDVKCLVGHDATRVVGSTRSGTLSLSVDAIGLRFHLDPPDSPTGRDLVESVKRRDLDGVSIGFRVRPDGEAWTGARPPVRELRDIDLFEISFVSWPAYSGAGVAIEARALHQAARIVAADRQQERWQSIAAVQSRLAALR